MKGQFIGGLHHVTMICGDAQANMDFYTGVLGLSLVKATVNFDDSSTYHLYYEDRSGTPGSLITFFPYPNARIARKGSGSAQSVALCIEKGSTERWIDHLTGLGIDVSRGRTASHNPALNILDPDRILLQLVENPDFEGREGNGGDDELRVGTLRSASLAVSELEPTCDFLQSQFGYEVAGSEKDIVLMKPPGERTEACLEICKIDADSSSYGGRGSIHHIALRAATADLQTSVQSSLTSAGFHVSPVMNRTYFNSIYVREPGGILLELATDGPGFAVDEASGELGRKLCLPEQFQSNRDEVVRRLSRLKTPSGWLP